MFFAQLLLIATMLFVAPSSAAGNFLSDAYCAYYDSYSEMLISVPAKSQLLEAGPSALSGIRLNLPDGTYFGIGPIMASEDFDEWDGISVTRGLWLDDYMREDCKLVDMPNTKARRITCPHSEHILLYKPAATKGGVDIYIEMHHEFEGNTPSQYYSNIIDSIQIFYGDAPDNTSSISGMDFSEYYPADPYKQVRNFCVQDRHAP